MSTGLATDRLTCCKYTSLGTCALFCLLQIIMINSCKCHLAQMLRNVVFVLAFPLPALDGG